MPKIFVHAPAGTFKAEGRARIAAALTDLGIACERLAGTESVRQGVWVFFDEHAGDAVFSGGLVASKPPIVLFVHTLQGGLDDAARTRLIEEATAIVNDNVTSEEGPVPVHVAIHETPEAGWGMYGKQVRLADIRA